MALKATIFKARVQLADMDRGLYADHDDSPGPRTYYVDCVKI